MATINKANAETQTPQQPVKKSGKRKRLINRGSLTFWLDD
ncbi:hypothetical protein O5286_29595, partial [Escherichia coli]|nr:hypothetical protein [Escherichia coli]